MHGCLLCCRPPSPAPPGQLIDGFSVAPPCRVIFYTHDTLRRLLAWDALLGMVLSRLPKDTQGLDCDVFER